MSKKTKCKAKEPECCRLIKYEHPDGTIEHMSEMGMLFAEMHPWAMMPKQKDLNGGAKPRSALRT